MPDPLSVYESPQKRLARMLAQQPEARVGARDGDNRAGERNAEVQRAKLSLLGFVAVHHADPVLMSSGISTVAAKDVELVQNGYWSNTDPSYTSLK